MPPAASLAALESGRIDIATLQEPFASQALASGQMRVLGSPFDAIAKHFDDAALYANPTWINALTASTPTSWRSSSTTLSRALARWCAAPTWSSRRSARSSCPFR